jgi:dTDP-4-amino-4,6-dideoxygalactose transaminase
MELEARFAELWGGAGLAVSSCTSALYLAGCTMRRRGRQGPVIVPALTFSSTAAAFAQANYEVALADVDPDTLLLSSESAARLAGGSPSAIVCVDLYGQRCKVAEVVAVAHRRGAAVIEDRAHRIGIDTKPEGDFVCVSFNTVKELPAGEGGLLWCRDPDDARYARVLSNIGMDTDPWTRSRTAVHTDYEFRDAFGLKLRLNDLAASLVLGALDEHEDQRDRRRALHEHYLACTSKLPPIIRMLPRHEDDSFLMQVARVPARTRDAIRASLAEASLATSVHYPALTQHPKFSTQSCPTAETVCAELVTLPSSTTMTLQDWRVIARALASLAELA